MVPHGSTWSHIGDTAGGVIEFYSYTLLKEIHILYNTPNLFCFYPSIGLTVYGHLIAHFLIVILELFNRRLLGLNKAKFTVKNGAIQLP